MLIFYTALITTLYLYWIPSVRWQEKKINIYFCSLFFLLTILGILRFNVGTDFMRYYRYFIRDDFLAGRFEPGYSFLNLLTQKLWDNPQAIIIVTHLIIMILAYKSINKYSINKSLSAFLFVFGFFYFVSLNGIRQYIAVMIILYGHMYLYKNSKKKFVISVIIASLFHYSAVITLIMLSIKNFKIKKKHIVTVYSLILVFNVFSNRIIPLIFDLINDIPFINKYSVYQAFLASDVSSKPYDFIVYSLILALSFFVSDKVDFIYKQYNLYKNILLVTVFLKGLALQFHLIDRIGIYFSIFIIFLIPIVFEELRLKYKKLIKFIMMIMFVLYCWIRIYSGQAGVLNYNFFIYN